MDEKEITTLANVLSQRGSMFLLELLDPKNQALLSLTGLKKQAAYQLEEMDDERVREILSEMDQARSSKIEEADHLKNKTG
ncbi:MAG: regulator [Candidatus Arsenophonus phytopathogenicus]